MKVTSEDFFESKILHTFLYYDRPLFYVTRHKNNRLFLIYFIDDEIELKTEQWFACYLEQAELTSLMKQEKGVLAFLREKISEEELYYAFVLFQHELKEWTVHFDLITESNLEKDALPSEEFYIDFDYKNNKYLTEE